MHMPESLWPEPRPFDVLVAIENLKIYKSPNTDKIPTGLFQEGGKTLHP
jgi:hypothetical protein